MLNSEHATASTAESPTAKASQLFASVEMLEKGIAGA
jgi:hypothetical protein